MNTTLTMTLLLSLSLLGVTAGCGDDATTTGDGDAGAIMHGDAGATTGSETRTASGVPGELTLQELDRRQVQQFCEWALAEQGGPHQRAMCDGGVTVDSGTVDGCVDSFMAFGDCVIDVGEMEDCIEAMSESLCARIDHPDCLPVRACGSR